MVMIFEKVMVMVMIFEKVMAMGGYGLWLWVMGYGNEDFYLNNTRYYCK